jgi:hypothetical protein
MGGLVEEMLSQFRWRNIGSHAFHTVSFSTLKSCLQAVSTGAAPLLVDG